MSDATLLEDISALMLYLSRPITKTKFIPLQLCESLYHIIGAFLGDLAVIKRRNLIAVLSHMLIATMSDDRP